MSPIVEDNEEEVVPVEAGDETEDFEPAPVDALSSRKKRMKDNGIPNQATKKERYTPKALLKLAEKYFAKCDETVIAIDEKTGMKKTKPRLKSGLAKYIKVHPSYFYSHKDKEIYRGVLDYIEAETMNSIEEGILVGTYNATAGIFNLKNHHGQTDKAEVKGDIDTTIKITFAD